LYRFRKFSLELFFRALMDSQSMTEKIAPGEFREKLLTVIISRNMAH